jgi:hypothetical protein
MKSISDNIVYIGKYDDLEVDFVGIRKINVLDWLLEDRNN